MKYIPKTKRSKPFTSGAGSFFVASSGVPYVGDVVQISSGKYYAYEQGDINLDKKLSKLGGEDSHTHVYEKENYIPREGFYYDYISQEGSTQSYPDELPQASYVLVRRNYDHQSYERFFVRNNVTSNVFEINPSTYTELVNKSNKYHWPSYTKVSFEWKIAGDVADKEINGYIVEGVETINRRAVEEASKSIPEIKNILTDYLEYHQ